MREMLPWETCGAEGLGKQDRKGREEAQCGRSGMVVQPQPEPSGLIVNDTPGRGMGLL